MPSIKKSRNFLNFCLSIFISESNQRDRHQEIYKNNFADYATLLVINHQHNLVRGEYICSYALFSRNICCAKKKSFECGF